MLMINYFKPPKGVNNMATRYINMQYDGVTETVDEFPYNNLADRKYLREMLSEYRLSSDQYHYISQRCTNSWKQE